MASYFSRWRHRYGLGIGFEGPRGLKRQTEKPVQFRPALLLVRPANQFALCRETGSDGTPPAHNEMAVFTRGDASCPRCFMEKPITINSKVSFGRPCPTGTGCWTRALFDRFMAGDSVAFIADDMNQTIAAVEAAIRYEGATKAQKKKMVQEL